MPRSWFPIAIVTAALVAWLFGSALSGASSFGFRDAAHYYHPLFEYIRGEWGAGRLPLWNPYENCGTPLVAEATSSVFYPGKLLFALPLDYTWLYNQYIVLHVVLAAATSFALARHLKSPPLGATLGAISYAFGGYVLFQYCNVIFLVGAAWLPLTVLYADQMLRQRRNSAIAGFGFTLALIVLGGDPHLAYNAAIVSAGYALLLWRNDHRNGASNGPGLGRRVPWRLVYLGCGLALGGLLSAVQVLATLEAAPYGSRAHFERPRNIYELAGSLSGSSDPDQRSAWGLLSGTDNGHHAEIYAFSLEPWRAIELVWPNVTGRPFPTHRRWLNALGVESNLWTPSLYLGLLPLLLAASTWTVRRAASVEVRGLSWLALFSAIAALGSFGLGAILDMIIGESQSFGVGGEFGGLYWLMTVVLPGYIAFRYPSKLLVLTSLALSMLAARGWRSAWTRQSRLPIWLAVIPGMSLLAGVAALTAWTWWRNRITDVKPNQFLGPFDWTGAWSDLIDGLLHASLLALALIVVLTIARKFPARRRWMQLAVVAITAVDLGAAQRYLIEFAPSELWRFRPSILAKLPADANDRVYRQLGPLPPSYERRISRSRYADSIRWDRESLYPKFPLPLRVPLIETSQNVAGYDYEVLLDVSRTFNKRTNGVNLPDPSVLDLLAARTAIVSPAEATQFADPHQLVEGLSFGTRPSALPRAWIVHEIDWLPASEGASPQELRALTRRVCFPQGSPRDWRQSAVVESDIPVADRHSMSEESPVGEACLIRHADPSCVEIEAKLKAPGLVVLSDQFFPGWVLTAETNGHVRRVPILRTNRVMRGVQLPAGEHRLVYEYRPTSVYLGAAISVATLAALGGWVFLGWRRGNFSRLQYHLRSEN